MAPVGGDGEAMGKGSPDISGAHPELPPWKLLPLDPVTPAAEAMRSVHRPLLTIILANEDGVRIGDDIEALHDFRVFMRRTRAGLRQMRRVYPKKLAKHFGKEFAWLGTYTGPARDLDVAIRDVEVHSALLSEAELEGLIPLVEHLDRLRGEAYRDLVAALDTERYARLVDGWRAFVNDPGADDASAPAASLPIIDVASSRIDRAFARILDGDETPGADTPAARLHRLRLDCKKLRYLLEFFGGLYDAEGAGAVIGALKGLQDTLGELNDLSVQTDLISGFIAGASTSGATVADSVGLLGTRMAGLAEVERERFALEFEVFAGGEVVADFRRQLQRIVGNN